jgi:hypothetical protein
VLHASCHVSRCSFLGALCRAAPRFLTLSPYLAGGLAGLGPWQKSTERTFSIFNNPFKAI